MQEIRKYPKFPMGPDELADDLINKTRSVESVLSDIGFILENQPYDLFLKDYLHKKIISRLGRALFRGRRVNRQFVLMAVEALKNLSVYMQTGEMPKESNWIIDDEFIEEQDTFRYRLSDFVNNIIEQRPEYPIGPDQLADDLINKTRSVESVLSDIGFILENHSHDIFLTNYLKKHVITKLGRALFVGKKVDRDLILMAAQELKKLSIYMKDGKMPDESLDEDVSI